MEFEDHRRIIIGPDEVLSVEPPRSRQASARERTGPRKARSHPDGLEDELLHGIDADPTAWSEDESSDEARPGPHAEDGDDRGPGRRDRRGG